MIRQTYYNPNAGTHVKLDEYISDLNLEISPEGYSCQPMCKDGFAYMWAGAKATFGVRRGKVCFEVKVAEELEVSSADFSDIHVVRVGWSTNSATLQLGEDKYSYGYGGTAKKSEDRRFADYGRRFGKGDVIGCYLTIENGWAEIFYCVNGRHCGSAFKVKWSSEEALFPHILTKNCRLEVNFGQAPNPYFSLQPGFKLIDHTPVELRVPSVQPPSTKHDCEVIMMVGLPGVGKSTWAMNYCKLHPSKKYNILGTDAIIDKMRLQGLPRKNNFGGRWDVLIKQASECFNILLKKASACNRNLILDQTNVYASARKRKVRQYKDTGYTVNAMVLVPTDEEMMRRSKQRTIDEGKEVPEAAVFDMKANFSLPHEDENLFNSITFLELQRAEAENLVVQYNADANLRGYKSNKQSGVGANQNQQEQNLLNRQFKRDSGIAPDSKRTRDRYSDARGMEDSRGTGFVGEPRDRPSRWNPPVQSPRSEARKRPDEERRATGPPEKYRRDSSPFHANPPARNLDERQPQRGPAQVGLHGQPHGRRDDYPATASRNEQTSYQQQQSAKREAENKHTGFPGMVRPQYPQTAYNKQERDNVETKSPRGMGWQNSDQSSNTEYGRQQPQRYPHDPADGPNIQSWARPGDGYGPEQSYNQEEYDSYGANKTANRNYQGGNNRGNDYSSNQQQEQYGQQQGDQYGNDYNYQGQGNTDDGGYGQENYGQYSDQQNNQDEYYDDGSQWNQQGGYGADSSQADDTNWGHSGQNFKSDPNESYQDQGYDQYGGDWNAQGEEGNWSAEQDQYYQDGDQSQAEEGWGYDNEQNNEYPYQEGDAGFNDKAGMGNVQEPYNDWQTRNQRKSNYPPQQSFHGQGANHGGRNFNQTHDGCSWGGDERDVEQGNYAGRNSNQQFSGRRGLDSVEQQSDSGFKHPPGPRPSQFQQGSRQRAPWEQQSRAANSERFNKPTDHHDQQYNDAGNRFPPGNRFPSRQENESPSSYHQRPVPGRDSSGQVESMPPYSKGMPGGLPDHSGNGRMGFRPPHPGRRLDEKLPQSNRGGNFNQQLRGQGPSERSNDEISDSTLSKLTSVDFDKLKASLANIRQAQDMQPARKHPYDLSDREIVDMSFPPGRPGAGNPPLLGSRPGGPFSGPPQRPSVDAPKRPLDLPTRYMKEDVTFRENTRDGRGDRFDRPAQESRDRGRERDRRRSPADRRPPRGAREKRPYDSTERRPKLEGDEHSSPRDGRSARASHERRADSPKDRERGDHRGSRDGRNSGEPRSRRDLPGDRVGRDSERRSTRDDQRRGDRVESRGSKEPPRSRERRETTSDRDRSSGRHDERKPAEARGAKPMSPSRGRGSPPPRRPLRPKEVKTEIPNNRVEPKKAEWNQLKAAEELITKVTGAAPPDLMGTPPSLMQMKLDPPGAHSRAIRPSGRPPLRISQPGERAPGPLLPHPKAGLLATPGTTSEEKRLMEEIALAERLYPEEMNNLGPRPRGPRPMRPGLRMRPPRPPPARMAHDSGGGGRDAAMRMPRQRGPRPMGPRPFPGDMPRRPMRPRMPEAEAGFAGPRGMRPTLRHRMPGPRPGLLRYPPRGPGLLRIPRGVRPRLPPRPRFAA